ncbi:unnamed protein product [Diamesa serratosioi]
MFRFITVLALIAAANAGIASYGGQAILTPTITSQHQNTLRSYGNLGQVSTFSKTIDTPYSSVSKSDVRVSNPGYAVAQPIAYHQPAVALAQPIAVAQPLAYHQPAVAYSAPIHAQPAVAYHAQPAVAYHAQPALQPAVKLGVVYSSAPQVAHMTYSNGLGYNYAW